MKTKINSSHTSNRKEIAASKKAKLLNEIRQGLKEVKDIRDGKAKSYSMSDLFRAQ